MPIINQIQRTQTIAIHMSTSNKSFLEMHYFLKQKGIQNNDFFLALLDQGLAGVNPRDPNLSPAMKTRILNECMHNYWYFLREVCVIPQQGASTSGGIKYQLHRGNLAMNFLFTLNYNVYCLLPRQFGKTVGAVCRYLWIYNFGTTNSEIMFFHKDHTGSKGNLKKLKEIRDALPSYLQLSTSINAEGKKLKVPNTIVMVQNPFNNNKITTMPSARTKESANNLGRGSTVPCLYMDEFAFMPYNKEVYLAAVPAFSTASQNAARNGAPYGMFITTTPGDLLTDCGQYAYDIYNKSTRWQEEYYDLTYEQLEGLRRSNTNSSFFLVEYTYKQLGRGQDYLNKMIVEMNKDWPAVRREVLLEWAETATDCPFTQEELDQIKLHVKEPIRTLFFGRFKQYQMNIYEDIDLAYPPIIGVDVAGATFNDSSAITIIDSKTTRVCATLNCNFIPADDLAEVIYEIITKYMPNAICSIERNGGFGVAVVQRLCKTSVKKNLYWEVKEKVIEETFNGARLDKQKRRVKVYGIDSTKDVRARLIEILMERVMYHKDKFVAPILLQEMQSMQIKKSGKVEHSDQSHDDQVFSYLMALYVWYDGKNLVENFHIRKSTIKTDTDEDLEEAEFETALEAREKVDFRSSTLETNEEISMELEWIEKDSSGFITSEDLLADQYIRKLEQRSVILGNDPELADKYTDDYGAISISQQAVQNATFTTIPDSAFNINDDDMFDDGDVKQRSILQGNLASFYDLV